MDPAAALREWQPAYKRGAAMQSSLALLGFALAAAAAFLGAGLLVGIFAGLMIAPWPWTYLARSCLNNRLLAMSPDGAGPEVPTVLDRWNTLHRVRTLVGAAATASLLWAALGQ